MSEKQRDWSLSVERGPDCLFVRFYGQIGLKQGDTPLAKHLWNIMRRHFADRVVLDFSGVERLTGYVVRQLIALGAQTCEHEGMMRICGLSEYNRDLLRRYELRDRLPAYDDRAEALLGHDRTSVLQPCSMANARSAEWL